MKRQEQKELTRKKLFNTALALFLEKGYDNVSVDFIVKEAGVTKGAFYHHFLSKEAILIEYNNKVLENLIQDLFKVIQKQEESSIDRLEEVFDKIIDFYNANFDLIKLMVRESNKANLSIEELFKNEIAVILRSILEKGVHSNEYTLVMEPQKLSLYMTLLLSEEFKTIQVYENLQNRKEKISNNIRDILRLLKNGMFIT